jgi:hypothetical protein
MFRSAHTRSTAPSGAWAIAIGGRATISSTGRIGKRSLDRGGAALAGKRSLAEDADCHLIYVDECEVHRHPRLAKVWQRRGCPMTVPAAGQDQKFVVYGGLEYASGRLIWQVSTAKDSQAFIAFLERLAAA